MSFSSSSVCGYPSGRMFLGSPQDQMTSFKNDKVIMIALGFGARGPEGQAVDWIKNWLGKRVGLHSVGDHTAVELIGRARPGLLSEIFAVLTDLHFNVSAAEVWTHSRRIACVLYVNNITTYCVVHDPSRLTVKEEQLKNILDGTDDDEQVAHISFSVAPTHVDRRLHQMLFIARDMRVLKLEMRHNFMVLSCQSSLLIVVKRRGS